MDYVWWGASLGAEKIIGKLTKGRKEIERSVITRCFEVDEFAISMMLMKEDAKKLPIDALFFEEALRSGQAVEEIKFVGDRMLPQKTGAIKLNPEVAMGLDDPFSTGLV